MEPTTIPEKAERPEFELDWPQAKSVFDALIHRLSQKGPPYNVAEVPQADKYLPSNLTKGSREQAIFLFMLCLWMRGGVESDTAARFLKAMYEGRPDVFEPAQYKNETADVESTTRHISDITTVLTHYRLGQRVEENARGWVYNMRKLDRFWQGNPSNLMNDTPSFEQIAERIIAETTGPDNEFILEDKPNGFMFFREKMVAMIAYFLIDAGLVPIFYTPVPVDFHVLRLLTTTGIIRVVGKNMEEAVGVNFLRPDALGLARQVTERYCRENKISPIALCDALWLLSRALCRNNPGNSGYVVNDRRKETTIQRREAEQALLPNNQPEFDIFDALQQLTVVETNEETSTPVTGRKRYQGFRHTPERLAEADMVKRYGESCGSCPIQTFCKYNISAGAYYVGGRLEPGRMRFVPPANQIEFIGAEGFEAHRLHASPAPHIRFTPIHVDEATKHKTRYTANDNST